MDFARLTMSCSWKVLSEYTLLPEDWGWRHRRAKLWKWLFAENAEQWKGTSDDYPAYVRCSVFLLQLATHLRCNRLSSCCVVPSRILFNFIFFLAQTTKLSRFFFDSPSVISQLYFSEDSDFSWLRDHANAAQDLVVFYRSVSKPLSSLKNALPFTLGNG